MRKTKLAQQKAEKVFSQLVEIEAQVKIAEAQVKEAENEEAAKMESAKQRIAAICEEENIFCGIMLTATDISNIVQLAIESKENIKIPFILYFND
jgi:hypothetical protein